MSTTHTPLRYPGGKSGLSDFLARIAFAGEMRYANYVEPYCGGAGAAINLLLREVVSDVFLNDRDRSIYCFWKAVLSQTEELCDRIDGARLFVEEWARQRQIWRRPHRHSVLDVGFACFFLNRVNRSGVLSAGLIGGKEQSGKWLMDARFNREHLIAKVRRIGRYRNRIHVSNLDAELFLKRTVAALARPTLIYLDPPYFAKGRCLYENHYSPEDHKRLAHYLRSGVLRHWLVSYDVTPVITDLYKGLRRLTYRLNYSAARRYAGREIAFFSPDLRLPTEMDPFVRSRDRFWNGCFRQQTHQGLR
jgi:DNA adenine methylase